MNEQRWNVTAASVRGLSHEQLGLPCQDAHQWAIISDHTLVAAVADGAGTAPLADVGAAVASRAAIKDACQRLSSIDFLDKLDDASWHKLLLETASATRAEVELEAQARSVPMSDLATTLIILVAGQNFIAAVQIGDGAIVAAESEETMLCVGRPAQGEYLNETTFLTSNQALIEAEPVVWRGSVGHLAVLSDGLQMAALRMPEAEPHPGFFLPLFRFVENQKDDEEARTALTSFLESPRLRERTNDDVTLILASLRH